MRHDFLKRSLVIGMILFVVGVGFTFHLQETNFVANFRTWEFFTSIQDAIDDPDTLPGDTLYVDPGLYPENVNVYKASLTIIGDLSRNQIVDGNGTGHAFRITADGVTLKYLTIKTSGNYSSVNIESDYNTVQGNNIQDGLRGVRVTSDHNTIKENDFEDCHVSVQVDANDNLVYNNTIHDCWRGIYLYSAANGNVLCNNSISVFENEGILLLSSSNNWIYSNVITGIADPYNGVYGILLIASSENSIYANDLQGSDYGLYLIWGSHSNLIHHNNFIDNTSYDAYVDNSMGNCNNNIWHKGSYSGGNYWNNLSCTDADNNLICDSAYSIPGGISDQDGYPLVSYWTPLKGNVDGDPLEQISMSDLTYLIAYLNISPIGEPEPITPCAADVNGDGVVDDDDLDYLIEYLFGSGPAPVGDCATQLVLPMLFNQ